MPEDESTKPGGADRPVEQGVGQPRRPHAAGTPAEFLANARDALDREAGKSPEAAASIAEARNLVDRALSLYRAPFYLRLLQRLGPIVYVLLATGIEIVFIELYCRWHGAKFLHWDIYSPENIYVLSNIDFVNGPTPMSIVAEVLMWSSLGVWANRCFDMIRRYRGKQLHPLRDIGVYAGVLIRNTTVAAIVIIFLSLTKFEMFGQSVKNFEAVAGLSFVLGFFGDDAYRIMASIKDRLVQKIIGEWKEKEGDKEEEAS